MQRFSVFFVPFATILFLFVALYGFNFFLGPLPINTNVNNSADLFTVSATGEANTSAQTATFTVGVTEIGETSQEAQTQVNTTMNQMLTAIKATGVKESDIKTETVSLSPNYDFSSGAQTVTGYSATQNVSVKAPIAVANKALDAATAAGANVVSGISFELTDADKETLQNQAREEAIKKAKEKAQNIANQAGIRLGKLVNVVEYNQDNPVPMLATRSMAVGASEALAKVDLQPGENKIQVNVTLYYETR